MKQNSTRLPADPPPRKKKGAQRNIFQKIAVVPHSVWTVMFIVAPMLFVLYFAFTTDGKFDVSNILGLTQYTNVFILSIAFALIATVICLIIGYPLAYFMSRQSPRMQKVLMVLIMLPMWCNLLIRTYALMALLDNGGLLNSLLESMGFEKLHIVGSYFGVVLGMVYDFLPRSGLQRFPNHDQGHHAPDPPRCDLGRHHGVRSLHQHLLHFPKAGCR